MRKLKNIYIVFTVLAIIITIRTTYVSYRLESVYNLAKSKKGKVYIDPKIQPYIDEFIVDSKKHKFDYKDINKLDSIVFSNDKFKNNWHGRTYQLMYSKNRLRGSIHISKELFEKDKAGFRLVVYHELGHWLGKGHEAGIMHKSYSMSDSSYIRKNWDLFVDHYYNPDKLMLLLNKKVFLSDN